ncbi:calponin homology domain-containing protein DDB_G0272472 isoform X4 [Oreochromis niloticus]|uniref:calponin homology domain-containing protein DDB_G0272472 isoform X4 n=1 Tax=Oreochromis niloticus TaxID=8128 RepID=UPI000DF1C9D9|nr:calponin homology domain-containing protein DDB_G0272472 isoform X4 [Oreochromis niloticus]
MERKSLLPGFPLENYEKDKKEEKRISLKKRKRVTDDEDENNLWRVKCGTKRGILDVEKLKKGEACIEYKGCLYSPPEFEKLAGKEPCRKWKSTIFYNELPLQFWFEEGYLTTTGYRPKKKKRKSCDSTEESEEDHVEHEDEDEEREDEHMDEEDVGGDESSSEDDEDEESDNDEDETAPAVASNHTDSSDIKERVTATIPTPGKHALEMKEVKGIVNILPEKTRHHPDMPRSEVTENPRDVAKNTAIKQQNVNKEPEKKRKKTTSSTISTPVKPALKIKEEKGVVNSLPERARDHPDMTRSEVTENPRDVAKNTAIKQQNVKKQPEKKLKKTTSSTISTPVKPALKIKEVKGVVNSLPEKARHHPDTTRSEVTENPRDVAKNTAIKQQNVKKQPEEELKKTTSSTISTLVKPALKIKEVKGVIKFLPEGLYNVKHNEKTRDHPDTTRSEVTENPRDVAKNTAIKQQNVKKQPEEEPKKTTSSTISTPVKPALKIKEVKGVVNSLPERARDHPDMTRSEVTENPRDVAKNTPIKQQNVKKQPEEELQERKEDHVEHEDEDEEQEDEHIDEDDVGEDEPRAERDEDEEGDIDEVETAPAVASNHTDSSDIKERVTDTIPTPGKHALEMKEVKGIINILPEKAIDHPGMPRSEFSGNNRDVATNTAIKQLNVKKEPEEELKERKEDHVEHEDEDEEQEDEHIDEDDVGEDEPRAEKDKDEEGDIDEVETAPAVASNHTDSSDIKERVTATIPTPGKHALEMKEVKGIINILPEQKTRHHPDMPRSEVSGNNKDVAKNTAIKQQNVKQPEEELKKTTSSTISTPVKPALKIKEEKGVVNSLPERARDHPDMTRSEVTENPRDVAKNTPIKQQNVKKQPEEELQERKEDHVEHEDEDEEQEDEHIDEDDVGDDEPRAEKDEDEEGDNDEDKSVPSVASNHTDSSDIKERVTATIPTPGQHALEMKEVKGIVNILPEQKTRHHPDMPRSEVSGNNKDVAKNTAIKQQNVKQPEKKRKKTTSSTISTPVKPALKIKEEKGVVNSLPEGLHNIKHLEKTRHHPEMPRSEVSGNKKDVAKNTAIKLQNVKKEPQDKLKKTTTSTISTPVKSALKVKEVNRVVNSLCQGLHNIKHLETRHHPEMPRSEVSGNKKDVAKNTAIKLQNVKKEPQDKLSLSCEPLAVSDQQEHKAVHCSGHKVADLQPMRPEGGADMMEALSPKPSGSSGLNTVDLDELKREEIKMQLTVLKLKEEYYTLKIKELKK